jgi:hypothetical protein
MTVKQIIKEAMDRNPVALKKTLEEELRKRVSLALEGKMKKEMDDMDVEDEDEDDMDDMPDPDMKKETYKMNASKMDKMKKEDDTEEEEEEEDTTPKKGKMPPQFKPGYKKD